MTRIAPRGRLFHKYALYLVGAVCIALLASGVSDIYFSQRQLRSQLAALQRDEALSAAAKIEDFVSRVEQQMGWITSLADRQDPQALHQEVQRLLRQAPAISEVRVIDATGREQLFVSRFDLDRLATGEDHSTDDGFRAAMIGRSYFGPVYFREQTEPYMVIALPRAGPAHGVVLADVNLKAVWDVISPIRIGPSGYAYVVDRNGLLIAHPDVSLALRRINLGSLPQVSTALAEFARNQSETVKAVSGANLGGVSVLATYVHLPVLDWTVLAEQPLADANAPLYDAVWRTVMLLLAGLGLAFAISMLLARHMVTPIMALKRGAERLAGGALDHRVDVRSGDELETVADQFNAMAATLQESYANLERKIEERTRELKVANQAKTRFLAAASHDLRQPVHALGFFISSLRGKSDADEIAAIVDRAEIAIEAVTELLEGLLDLSKLDAGVMEPVMQDFPVKTILDQMTFDFATEAQAKELAFRVVPSNAIVRSDATMLTRILLNLVANAIRFTGGGRILIGCRRRGDSVRIEVHDTGAGIAVDQRDAIFQEFYKIAPLGPGESRGLGLGLSIVRRLADMLGCRLEVASEAGRGSTFAVTVPLGDAEACRAQLAALPAALVIGLQGRSVLLIDDDPLVLDAMRSLLGEWGCRVTTARSGAEAEAHLAGLQGYPDVVICDYTLQEGETGIEVLDRLVTAAPHAVTALLMTGDTAPELLRIASAAGYPTLHKPVRPARLRSAMSRLLAAAPEAVDDE